jgi:general secretion pathway protein C
MPTIRFVFSPVGAMFVAAVVVACGGAPTESATAAKATPSASAAPVQDLGPKGAVTRTEVDNVVLGGPGYFLRTVTTEPAMDHGAFKGFRIIELPKSARWASVDVRVGDVVSKVNGTPVSTPDDAMKIFGGLRTANAIVVDGERAGAPFQTTIPIVEK